ncbi:hypothetical protein ACFLY9_00685 [Patescibacteria group bacterium]
MDLTTYIEQLSEILKYIWKQIDWNFLTPYYPYIIAGIILIVILFIISRIITRKRAVKEYITDGVSLKIDLSSFVDREQKIEEFIGKLHKVLFELYSKKFFFSVEILSNVKGCHLFVVLPYEVYKHLEGELSSKYKFEIVTKAREEFFEKMSQEVLSIDLELASDFVNPLNLPKKEFIELTNQELYLTQLLCRPLPEKWNNTVDRYINRIKKGKSMPNEKAGCIGGFLRITFPFFSFIGDFITFIIHGSDNGEINKQVDEKPLDQVSAKKLDLAISKKDKCGFETAMRVLVKGSDKERSYYIADKLMDMLTFESEGYNYYAVSDLKRKLKTGLRNDYLLAFMDKSSVDVLNKKEIRRFINSLLTY